MRHHLPSRKGDLINMYRNIIFSSKSRIAFDIPKTTTAPRPFSFLCQHFLLISPSMGITAPLLRSMLFCDERSRTVVRDLGDCSLGLGLEGLKIWFMLWCWCWG